MPRHHINEPPKGTKGIRERVQFWLYVVGTVVTLLGGAIAWGSSHLNAKAEAHEKVLQQKLDAKLDVTTYQRDHVVDSAWKADTHDLLIDVLCSRNVDPRNQKCAPRR